MAKATQTRDSGFKASQIFTVWKCERVIEPSKGKNDVPEYCGQEAHVVLTELPEIGNPQCPDCDCDMVLQEQVLVTT